MAVELKADVAAIRDVADRVRENVSLVIVGRESVIDLALVALLCGGHVLVEDVPGIGKTMMTKALARSIGAEFRRIQFTPDLMPSDITGNELLEEEEGTGRRDQPRHAAHAVGAARGDGRTPGHRRW